MKTRKIFKVLPAEDHPAARLFFSVTVPPHGPVHFKTPRLTVVGRLFGLIPQSELQKKLTGSGVDKVRAVAARHDRMCEIIGRCWYHLELELEADPKASNYDELVADELHEAGFTELDVAALFGIVYAHLVDNLKPREAAKELVKDFPPAAGVSLNA